MVDKRRVIQLNTFENDDPSSVVYWMARDQRVHGNWALLYAQEVAEKNNASLSVIFCLNPNFLGATLRQYDFMLKGLEEVEQELKNKNISFHLLFGNPEEEVVEFLKKHEISTLITDFSPLRISRKWKKNIANKIEVPFYEVDAHNIVPCTYVSNKQEFGAYTIRPKINRLLDEFLTPYPRLKDSSFTIKNNHKIEWGKLFDKLNIDNKVKPVDWIKPGYKHALKVVDSFIENKIRKYNDLRNDPTKDFSSNLSPYLHFGQISSQEVVMTVCEKVSKELSASFIEEIVIRKELSDNFCYFNDNYDNPEGFPDWAKKSHLEHKKDKREYLYSKSELESAETHDELWNAAQKQMINYGKMHGYLRMYWAKKIMEWTENVDKAMEIAIYLNDKYELDGRDPNGYTGIAWSLGGVHDRAWFERTIFGKIRYMNYNGCLKKFDVEAYIRKYNVK